MTPAMAAGITDHQWEIDELLYVLSTEPKGAPPVAQPLEHRKPETTSRELPGGRGFLRVVAPNPYGTPSKPIEPPPNPTPPAQAQTTGPVSGDDDEDGDD